MGDGVRPQPAACSVQKSASRLGAIDRNVNMCRESLGHLAGDPVSRRPRTRSASSHRRCRAERPRWRYTGYDAPPTCKRPKRSGFFREQSRFEKSARAPGRLSQNSNESRHCPAHRGGLQARGAASKPLNVAVCVAAGTSPASARTDPPFPRSTHAQACSRIECVGTGGIGRRIRSGGRRYACRDGGSSDAELHEARCGCRTDAFRRSKRPIIHGSRRAFTSADANRDGYLSKAEYAQMREVGEQRGPAAEHASGG